MADVLTKKQRSYCMSRIRSSKTKPELKLKRLMHHLEFSYQPKGLLGKPDFADRKRKIAVFIDGCFWHGCPRHGHYPKSNAQFWKNKILTNKKRDKRFNLKLKENGWRVIRVWEHELR